MATEREKLISHLTEKVMKDQNAPRGEFYFKPPAPLEKLLRSWMTEDRDLPVMYLMYNICVTVVPGAALMYALPPSHLLGVIFLFASQMLFLQRFILGLHYSEHRSIFDKKKAGKFLNPVATYLLCPLFGIPTGVYRLHHVIMHHIENNSSWDLSSTEHYQRNNVLHFLFYWMRFSLAIWMELPYYAWARGRNDLFIKCMCTSTVYLGGLYYMHSLYPVQTLWVFMVPFGVASFAMMFGNWSQHMFVDPAKSRSSYSLAYNCVDTPDNQKSFNDGYHIIHHVNPRVHWTDMPKTFLSKMDEHIAEDSLVFMGIGFFEVGALVFSRQLGRLADNWVDLQEKPRSREQKIEILKERLKPVKSIAGKCAYD